MNKDGFILKSGKQRDKQLPPHKEVYVTFYKNVGEESLNVF